MAQVVRIGSHSSIFRREVILSVDTAAKATATSNYSAMLVFLVRNNNEFYLIEVCRKKLVFPDLLAAVEALITKHKPNAILIEDHSSGTGLCQQLQKNGFTGIIPTRPVNDKATRMSTETPKLQAGNLSAAKGARAFAKNRVILPAYAVLR